MLFSLTVYYSVITKYHILNSCNCSECFISGFKLGRERIGFLQFNDISITTSLFEDISTNIYIGRHIFFLTTLTINQTQPFSIDPSVCGLQVRLLCLDAKMHPCVLIEFLFSENMTTQFFYDNY